jgi:hypothetical protein
MAFSFCLFDLRPSSPVCTSGGCSRAAPAREHRGRPHEGADVSDRVTVDDEQVGVIDGPQPTLPVSQSARGRGERGRRRQRGGRLHLYTAAACDRIR